MKSIWIFVFLAVASFLPHLLESAVRYTNLKCESLHSDFSTFEKCNLKVVGRSIIALNIEVKLWQVPVTNVSVNLSLHKKFSGYRPFLYNITLDFCKFMKNRNSSPFFKIYQDMLLQYSNFNHRCPFNHNIIIENAILNENHFKYLPLPRGDYMLQMKVGAYNEWKAVLKTYIEIASDL